MVLTQNQMKLWGFVYLPLEVCRLSQTSGWNWSRGSNWEPHTDHNQWKYLQKLLAKIYCQAVKPPYLARLYLLVIRNSKYFNLGWMWFDTELSSEANVKASDNSSEGPLSTSLYALSSWLSLGMKPGRRWLDFSVCHRWPAAFGEGLSPWASERAACWYTCWMNPTQKQDKGEKNAS